VFENRVLRRIIVPMREKVARGWKRLNHNEELYNLYASPIIIGVIKSMRKRRVGHVASRGQIRNAYYILADKPQGKRSL
jgi:hypothetical protein